MATRGEVKRAVAWVEYVRTPRLKRARKDTPPCVTCGSGSDHEFARGEPSYPCRHDEPFRIDHDTLERGLREFGRPKGRGD